MAAWTERKCQQVRKVWTSVLPGRHITDMSKVYSSKNKGDTVNLMNHCLFIIAAVKAEDS